MSVKRRKNRSMYANEGVSSSIKYNRLYTHGMSAKIMKFVVVADFLLQSANCFAHLVSSLSLDCVNDGICVCVCTPKINRNETMNRNSLFNCSIQEKKRKKHMPSHRKIKQIVCLSAVSFWYCTFLQY